MLGPRDPLSPVPQRILVAGLSGAGKTTLAARLATVLGIPHTEIDALHHGAGWQPRSTFLDDVDALIAGDAWITEWQYRAARPRLVAAADTLVWLDLPLAVSMRRLVVRTVRRRLRRVELWNGNVEPPLHTILRDPEHVVRYAWAHRRKYRDRLIPDAIAAHPHLRVVRLQTQAEVDRWVAGLPHPGD